MPIEIARLAVIIVSANSAQWLRSCLTTLFERAGDVDLEVVVVASGCTEETIPLVRREFPAVRTISCANHGFAYGHTGHFGRSKPTGFCSSIPTPRSWKARFPI